MDGLNLPPTALTMRLTHGVQDHFIAEDTTQWTTTATDSGSSTCGDAAGGVMVLAPSDGTVADNDEVYFFSAKETFRIAANKPLFFEAKVQYAEANTDDANVLIGILDGWAANTILDDGGGPKASYSGAVFYKVDGGTRWFVEYSDGATQTTAELTAVNSYDKVAKTAGGSAYQTFTIEITSNANSTVDVCFFIDGSLVYKMKDQTYANATELSPGVGAKNGGGSAESVSIDYIQAFQKS